MIRLCDVLMKKFWLNPVLLSLAILFMSASNLTYSFNAQASYDPGETGVIEYSDDGGVMLQSITINAEDISKFNEINDYEEEEKHENFNNSAQQNNESFTPIAEDVSKFNEINEEKSTPEKNYSDSEEEKYNSGLNASSNNTPTPALEEQHENFDNLAQQNNAFTLITQDANYSDEDNTADENNLPIVVDTIQIENGCDEGPSPQPPNIYSNEEPLLSPIYRLTAEEDDNESLSEQEEKTNCCTCGCFSVLFKKFW